MDWKAWHGGYDDPGSELSRRLEVVRGHLRRALTAQTRTLISVCAGDGRDILGVLAEEPRREGIRGLLVELDPVLAARARAMAPPGIEVRQGDAALVGTYARIAPADLLMLCGIFGNISDEDIRTTIGYSRQLCATGAAVVWTRHRRPPDLVPQVCAWFEERGFEPVSLTGDELPYAVGVHRFAGQTEPLAHGAKMFTFVR